MRFVASFLASLALASAALAGPRPYTQPPPIHPAIHFDQLSQDYVGSAMQLDGATIPTTTKGTVSFWVRGVPLQFAAGVWQNPQNFTAGFADFVTAIEVSGQNSETVPGQNTVFDNNKDVNKTLRVNLSEIGSTSATPRQCLYVGMPGILSTDWTHILYSWDTSGTSSSKLLSTYINGVKQGSGGCTYKIGATPTAAVMNIGVSNSNGWGVVPSINGNTTGQPTIEIADVFVDYDHAIVDSSNNIPLMWVRKFIDKDNAPVDLGRSCEKVFGAPTHLCFTGAPSNFAVNRGRVTSAFTIKGLNVTGGPTYLFSSSYGPGRFSIANRVLVKGTFSSYSTTTGQVNPTTITSGIPIKQNDLLIQMLELFDSGSSVINHAITCPTGYTALTGTPVVGTSNQVQNAAVCYKFAATDGESDAVQWNWSTGNGSLIRFGLLVLSGVNTSTPIGASAITAVGTAADTTTFTAPSITPSADNSLLLNLYFMYRNGHVAQMPSAVTSVRYLTGATIASATNAHILVNGEQLAAAGVATQNRAITLGASSNGWAMSLEIEHN